MPAAHASRPTRQLRCFHPPAFVVFVPHLLLDSVSVRLAARGHHARLEQEQEQVQMEVCLLPTLAACWPAQVGSQTRLACCCPRCPRLVLYVLLLLPRPLMRQLWPLPRIPPQHPPPWQHLTPLSTAPWLSLAGGRTLVHSTGVVQERVGSGWGGWG